LRRLAGDEYFRDVAMVSFVYDDSTGTRYDINNSSSCEEVLSLLAGMSGLRTVLLQGTQATDAGLAHLRGMTGLVDLYIWDASLVTNAGVAHLAGLPKLKKVHIGNSRMTDVGLGHLGGSLSLEEMSLQGNRFTDAGLARLRGKRGLRGLYVGLGKGEISDAGMGHLAGLTGLEILDIQGTGVTDAGLEHLKRLPKLKEIWTSGSRVTPEGVKALQREMPSLKAVR
jgi:hypothetical protein